MKSGVHQLLIYYQVTNLLKSEYLAILIAFLSIFFFGFGVFGNDEKILQEKIIVLLVEL